MATASEATDKDFEQMMQMLTGFFVTQIAGAVATYSIADHLAKGPATAEQMATLEEIDPGATFRLLRACASLGLVTCNDGRTFSPTPLLSTLRSNVPGSLHGIAIAWSAPGHWLPWGRFPDAVRTSECQTVPALGASIWDYYARQPEESAAFIWNDGQAVRILQNCRRAMRPSGPVVVIELVLSEIGEPGPAPLMDLNMMVMLTGRERSRSEYRALLKQAGFQLDKSSPVRSSMAVIEAVAA
jgi:O-methyltransferase domain/Dimerisation domain